MNNGILQTPSPLPSLSTSCPCCTSPFLDVCALEVVCRGCDGVGVGVCTSVLAWVAAVLGCTQCAAWLASRHSYHVAKEFL